MSPNLDDIKRLREEWKRRALDSLYPPEQVDYQRFLAKRNAEPAREDYETPTIPLQPRFEALWMVGRQGSGKTQFFKHQAKRDLDMVAAGDASMVIIDPTGCHPTVWHKDKIASSATLIHTVSRLRRFYKDGDLYGRLVYIDPTDRDYSIPINLFSINPDLDDEDAVEAATSSYISIIAGLMRQPLTPFQEPVLRYVVQAAMAFENPTLSTLRDLLTVYPPASKTYTPPPPRYLDVLHKLDSDTQEYFIYTYDTQTPRASRAEVLNRLSTMTASPKFKRIFGAVQTKLDLAKLINEPNVIIINASRASLKSMTEVYGRYFLSLIRDAGLSRPPGSIPCFVYVDECHQFIANDETTHDIVFSLRQKRVALMLGNQSTRQILNKTTLDALLSTSIKLVNVREQEGARLLAESMGIMDDSGRIDFRSLMARPAFNFAYHEPSLPEPIPYCFEPGELEAEASMTEEEFAEIYGEIRERFYEPVQRRSADRTIPPAPPSQPIEVSALKPETPSPTPKMVKPKPEGPTDEDTYEIPCGIL